MNYLTWINQLRAQTGDTKRRVHVDWTGDGVTTVFQMPLDTFPVYDDTTTRTVKVNAVEMVEGVDYSIDTVTGTITFTNTPANNHAVFIDCIAVYLQDADWIQVTNDVIKGLGDDYWKEFTDDAGLTTTANALSISLTSAHPTAIAIYEFQHRESSSQDWYPVEELCNWRYDRENNAIYLGVNVFSITGQALRVRGLKTYTPGSSRTDTLDVQDRFLTVLEYGCIARYWRWRYKHVVELISKMSTEATRTPLQEIIMLSDRFDRLYEIEKAKLKPQKPARIIPPYKQGGGRP